MPAVMSTRPRVSRDTNNKHSYFSSAWTRRKRVKPWSVPDTGTDRFVTVTAEWITMDETFPFKGTEKPGVQVKQSSSNAISTKAEPMRLLQRCKVDHPSVPYIGKPTGEHWYCVHSCSLSTKGSVSRALTQRCGQQWRGSRACASVLTWRALSPKSG